MQVLRELNTVTLRPLDLHNYDNMPTIVGQYRVRRHFRFGRRALDGDDQGIAVRLSESAFSEIVQKSKPVTQHENFLNIFGSIPPGAEQAYDLSATIYEYNPRNLPPIALCDVDNS